MVVLHLTDCPAQLRGDLTKWLMEISTGVYIGHMNTRVREALWEKVKEVCGGGRAVLVYTTNNEQKMDFKVHGDTWQPIDFDGIKLMLRPNPSKIMDSPETIEYGFSNAAKKRLAQRFSNPKLKYPENYVVLDLETTGLNPETDEIIEIGAIKVYAHGAINRYHTIVCPMKPIPESVSSLTGITNRMVRENGKKISCAVAELLEFIGDMAIVAHNSDFDTGFLLHACAKCGIPLFTNRCIDTVLLSKRLVHGLTDYKLITLADKFGIDKHDVHRSMGDCEITLELYQKLIKMMSSEIES